MPPGERREYAGNAPPRTLTSGIDNATLTIGISNGDGWPTGVTGPFFAVIDKGLTTEEKIKCASRTGAVLTVQSGGRGVDGTSAASHAGGASIEHVIAATDMDQMNQHYSDPTLDHHTQYLTTGRHDTPTRHGLAVLDVAALTLSLIPPGVMWEFAGAVAPTGWLLCDGSAVSRTTYANLYAAIGTTYGVGDGTATFNLPDARSRSTVGSNSQNTVGGGIVANVGLGAGLTARARGAAFGVESHSQTLTSSHLPSHAHTINEHTHSGTTGDHDRNHSHYANLPETGGHTHTIGGDGGFIIGRSHGGAAHGIVANPIERMTFSDMQSAGHHGHDGWTDAANTGHLHGFTTGGASDRGTNAIGSGTAFTVPTVSPSLTVHKIIKT